MIEDMVGMQRAATAPQDDFLRRFRLIMLAGILLNLALIVGQLLLYSPLLAQPNALTYVLEPIVGLLVYAALTLGVTYRAGPARRRALRTGSVIGVIGGVLFVINLASETFLDLPAPASLIAT